MTTHILLPADAYALAYLPAVATVTAANYEILDAAAATEPDAELAHAILFSRAAVRISDARARAALKSLHDTAGRLGLTLPEGPTAAPGSKHWLAAARKAAEQTLDTADQAGCDAFAAGRAAGDLYLVLWQGRNLIYLRTAAPEHALLRKYAAQLGHELTAAGHQLSAALGRAGAAQAVAAAMRKLTGFLIATPDLVAATTKDSFQAYFGWATLLSAQLDELGPALAAGTSGS